MQSSWCTHWLNTWHSKKLFIPCLDKYIVLIMNSSDRPCDIQCSAILIRSIFSTVNETLVWQATSQSLHATEVYLMYIPAWYTGIPDVHTCMLFRNILCTYEHVIKAYVMYIPTCKKGILMFIPACYKCISDVYNINALRIYLIYIPSGYTGISDVYTIMLYWYTWCVTFILYWYI